MSLKLPNIPSLPSNVDASVRRAFDSLRSWFAEVTKKGGLLDRMSGEELVDELLPSEWTDGAIPPKPRNVQAHGAFRTIILEWDDPHYLSLAHAEIWRSTTDSLADAQKVGTEAANVYSDAPPAASLSITYWYWVRFISKAGIAGPFSDPASASTADDPEYVLQILTDRITASELDKSLSERIDLIDLPETGLWDRLAEAEAELDVAMANIGEITTEDFDENETYNVGRLVKYEGKIYRSIKDINDTPAPLPTDTEYWKLVGEYASLSDMLAATAYGLTTIDARTDNAEDELVAHAQQLTALEATVDDPATGVVATRALLLSDYSTTATTNSAIVSAKNAAIATANNNTATQLQSYYTKSETDSAVTVAKNAAIAAAGNNLASTIAEYTNTADMTQAITAAKESAISSANGNTAGLLVDYATKAELTSASTTAKNEAISAANGNTATLLNSYTTTAGMTDAINSASTSAQNYAISQSNSYTGTYVAAQLQNYYTKTDTNSAISSASNTLQAEINNNTAAIATEQLVRATSTGPDWKINVNYYKGETVVRNNALYQAQSNHYSSNANGPPNTTYWKPVTSNLYAQHMVKIDNNGYVAGYGLANDGISSQFRVRADTFSIGSPGRPDVTPFVVDTAENRVVMSNALIKNLTALNIAAGAVTADKIAASAITAAKIKASEITTGHLAANSVTAAKIAAGAITADKIAAGAITADKIAAGAITVNNISADKINAGSLNITWAGGNIRSGKATYASTVAGWWLGNDAGTAKFHIGNSTHNLKWTGAALEVNGQIIGTSNIKNESVTTLRVHNGGDVSYARNTQFTWSNGGSYTISSATITTTGAPVVIIPRGGLSANLLSNTYQDYLSVELYRGSTRISTLYYHDLWNAGPNDFSIGSSLGGFIVDQPSSGTYTYYLKVSVKCIGASGNTISVKSPGLLLLECKK